MDGCYNACLTNGPQCNPKHQRTKMVEPAFQETLNPLERRLSFNSLRPITPLRMTTWSPPQQHPKRPPQPPTTLTVWARLITRCSRERRPPARSPSSVRHFFHSGYANYRVVHQVKHYVLLISKKKLRHIIQSGPSGHSLGLEDNNLGSSPACLGSR